MNKINIYAFADEASPHIDEQITALKRNGLNGLEIRNVDGVNVSDITTEKAQEVKRKLQENGLITWSVGSPIGKIDIEKDDWGTHIDKLKHTLEIASILESKNIRMFSFYIPEGKEAELYKSEVIDTQIPVGIILYEMKKGLNKRFFQKKHEKHLIFLSEYGIIRLYFIR